MAEISPQEHDEYKRKVLDQESEMNDLKTRLERLESGRPRETLSFVSRGLTYRHRDQEAKSVGLSSKTSHSFTQDRSSTSHFQDQRLESAC